MATRAGHAIDRPAQAMVDYDSIDTVLLAFTDMQGRLQGKRCAARYFLDEVVPHAAEACNYLLAVDVDMNTVDGYAMSSWERGYGDMVLAPDWSTLRLLPWHEATALVLCDVQWADRSPVVASPRQVLAASWTGWPSAAWSPTSAPSWSSCCSPTPSTPRGARTTAASSRPTCTTWTTRCWAPRGSSRCCGASATAWPAPAWSSSRPRASATSASTRSPSATPTR